MRRIKILIFANESLVAQDIQKSLDHLGYSITSVASEGKQVLKKISEEQPDLVLIDIVPPEEIDGIQVAKQIRRHWDIPVVYISAPADEKTLEATKRTEPYGYILKPIDEKELHVMIELSIYKHAAEKKLKERQERLRLFLDAASDTFCLLDSALKILEMNETGLKSWGIRKRDLKDRHFFEVFSAFSGPQKEDWRSEFEKTIVTGMPFLKNSVVLPVQAGEKIVNVRGFKAGNGLGLIITDITTQSKVEQALRKSEESYKTLIENINEGIAMLDEYGVISYINEKFVRAQGFVPAEVIGHPIKEFIDKRSLKVVGAQMEKSRMGWHEPYEIVWRKKDGGKVTTLVSPTPIHEKGRYFGSIAVLTDISERRRVEEELGRSRERLRNLSRHLQSVREEESKRIAREIHDELGQALTALKMDVAWLSGRLPEGLPDRKAFLDKTKAMLALMDKTIQTVQKISSELRPGLLDDLGLLPAIEWQAQEFQERTNIKCQLEFDGEFPDLDSDLSTAIFRVFQEALTNVARHSQADSIVVQLKRAAGKMELRISDNGIGIPEKAVHAADSLGLMGMRERLLPFGGELTISGEPKVGTTLTVVLPLKAHKAND